jgi:hypothetical protein
VTCPYACEKAPLFVLLDSEFSQVLSCKMRKDKLENDWSSTLVRAIVNNTSVVGFQADAEWVLLL